MNGIKRYWFLGLFLLSLSGCDTDAVSDSETEGVLAGGASSDVGNEQGTGMTNDAFSGEANDGVNDAVEEIDSSVVTFVTSLGTFTVELDADKAPITVANFQQYVESGFYDGDDGLGATTFHRVISGFMVQGGGLTADLFNKTTQPPIVNESTNGLLNVRGSVAMARTNDPNSATSQFFVNHVDNDFLNYTSPAEPGYAVFGQVVEGMDVIDAIASVPTGGDDVPLDPVEVLDVFYGTP